MPWSKTNTIPSLSNKSEKVKEVFAEAANAALNKGNSEEEAVFAGLAAVKNYEKKNQVSKAIIQPKVVPLHIQAVVEAKKAKELLQGKQQQLEKEVQAIIPDYIIGVTVDEYSRLVTTYSSGKKTVSKPLAADITEIQNTIVAGIPEQPVQKYAEPLTTLVNGNPEFVFTSDGDVVMQLIELTETE